MSTRLRALTALSLTPPQLVEVAARTGYQYAGVRMTRVTPDEVLYPLSTDRGLRQETKARMADTGIRILDIELLRMDPTLDADHFLPCLEAGAELGAHHAIAQLPDPDRERAIARFARLCDLAKPLDIFVSLEFPHWTETGNLAEATRVVRAVNRSNAGILIDMLHFGRSDSSLEELAKLPREWFRFALSATPPRKFRRPWPASSARRATSASSPARGGSTCAAFWPGSQQYSVRVGNPARGVDESDRPGRGGAPRDHGCEEPSR